MSAAAFPSRAHLILGGAGFLGRHVARALADVGQRVTAVDLVFPADTWRPPVSCATHDLFSLTEEELTALIAPHDVIHHYAWSSIPATAETSPVRDLVCNVGFTVRLLTALQGTNKTLLFSSSGGTIYGRNSAEQIGEDAPTSPIGIYGAGKAAAECYLATFWRTHDLDVRIARLSNPFGAGQSRTRLQGAVSHFTFEALAGRTLQIWGNGSVVRDYIHVEDAAQALVCLAQADRRALCGNHAVNIASGYGVSLNEIVAVLSEVLGWPVDVDYGPSRAFDVPRNVLNIGRAYELLNWSPSLSFRDGLRRMIADLRHTSDCMFSGIASPPLCWNRTDRTSETQRMRTASTSATLR